MQLTQAQLLEQLDRVQEKLVQVRIDDVTPPRTKRQVSAIIRIVDSLRRDLEK